MNSNRTLEHRTALLVFVVLAILFPLVAGASAATSSGESVRQSDSLGDGIDVKTEMPYWQAFRERFQMDSSESRILEIANSETGRNAISEYSAPLTESEERELLARYRHEEEASVAVENISSWSGFAGVHIDQPGGGLVFVSFSRQLSRTEANQIREMFTRSEKVSLRTVKFSLKDLVDYAEVIRAALQDTPDITGTVSISERDNALILRADDVPGASRLIESVTTVEARIDPLEPAQEVETPDVLIQRGSEGRAATCTNRWLCGPGEDNRAGLHIATELADGSVASCTSGFMVTQPQPPHTSFMLTAGHCSDDSGQQLLGGNVNIGGEGHSANNHFEGFNTYTNGANNDSVLVGIDPADDSNHIYKDNNRKFKPIKSVKRSGFAQGASACIATYRTGGPMRCGEIVDGNDHANYGAIQLQTLVRMNFVWPGPHRTCRSGAFNGASGGPVFNNNRAFGIISGCVWDTETHSGPPNAGSTTMEIWFSRIALVESAQGVVVKTS